MTAKFGIMAAVCALIWIAGLADASAQRHFNPDGLDAPRRMCTFERCYGRCVSQGGARNAGGRPAISCSRMCARRCPR